MTPSEPSPAPDTPVQPTLKIDPGSRKLLGRDLGGYRIVGELGRGGMGMVYRAHDPALDRSVAIKVLPAHLQEDEEFAQRFEREARAAAKLDHPNVVTVFAGGRTDDGLWMAMQLVEGATLADLRRQRPIGIRESLDFVRQAALGLESAHRLGIVHRDVKPANLLVDGSGRVKVSDFGLAKAGRTGSGITRGGTYLGTPEYSSPEQCETREVDSRSDLYSLGVVLYELLSGRLPHSAETPLSLFRKIVEERPVPVEQINPAVPRSVRDLLGRMLEKSPDRRIGSAGEVAAAIATILATEKFPDGGGAPPPVTERVAPSRRELNLRVAMPGGIVVALLALVGLWLVFGRRSGPEPVTTGGGGPGRVAVFDFANGIPGSGAGSHDWFEVGIAEMLLANLGQNEGIDAVLRDDLTLELQANAKPGGGRPGGGSVSEEMRAAAARLEARWLVVGKFYVQDEVRILAQVHERNAAGSWSSLASVQAEGKPQELFGVVDTLSSRLVARLRGQSPASDGGEAEGRIAQGVQGSRRWAARAVEEKQELPPPDETPKSGGIDLPELGLLGDLDKALRARIDGALSKARESLSASSRDALIAGAGVGGEDAWRLPVECEAKRLVSGLTPGDREATQDNLRALRGIFAKRMSQTETLKKIERLIQRVEAEKMAGDKK